MKSTKSTNWYIPQRTCVACHQVRPKSELVRLVRVSDGRVEVNAEGRKTGRGAYLCRVAQCWQVGLRGNRLEHALRITLTPDNRQQLIRYGEKLIGESIGGRDKQIK